MEIGLVGLHVGLDAIEGMFEGQADEPCPESYNRRTEKDGEVRFIWWSLGVVMWHKIKVDQKELY